MPQTAPEFIQKEIFRAVIWRKQAREQVTEQVTEQAKRLIVCLGLKEKNIKEILEELNLRHRPTLIYDYIKPAVNLELIEMTQTDSPNSPTQKYRLTEKGKSTLAKLKD